MTWLWLTLMFAGGYVASIYSWDWIHTQAVGVAAKIQILKDKAIALEQKLRG